jgi:cytochrome bd-type quinol oxidase subunit 2
MEKCIEPMHGIGTIALLLLYLILALVLFRKKESGIGILSKALAQVARFALLLVYLSGLFLTVTLGRIVNNAHHVLSALPVIAFLLIPFLTGHFQKEQKNKVYAWLFAILFLLILFTAISSYLTILPKL